ncbi:MAG: sulfatase-like hydrolase/transferase, partial [Caldilineaceae bacterium]|nr:sulfatase-like hydrolase/transferase [Caldilineaceae bacterium]
RMETIDDEVTDEALRFIDEANESGKPFFVWYNTTAMHFRTHVAEKHVGKSGQGFYNDAMVAHDENIGRMLDKLDELGIAEDTIVMYSTDNGVHYNTWPDAGITPFRSEKNTNWEGGWRVPAFVRWPGKFKAGTVLNGIVSMQEWLPTFLAAAGEPDIKEKLLEGYQAGDKTYKVHIDGFNILPYLMGEVDESPRNAFFYISDDGDIL